MRWWWGWVKRKEEVTYLDRVDQLSAHREKRRKLGPFDILEYLRVQHVPQAVGHISRFPRLSFNEALLLYTHTYILPSGENYHLLICIGPLHYRRMSLSHNHTGSAEVVPYKIRDIACLIFFFQGTCKFRFCVVVGSKK